MTANSNNLELSDKAATAIPSSQQDSSTANVVNNSNNNNSSIGNKRKPNYRAKAIEFADKLQEPNQFGIQRVCEIFGLAFTEEQVREAERLHREAQEKAQTTEPDYYKTHARSPIATDDGQARTLGGVFFNLVRNHVHKLGMDWHALHVYPRPGQQQQLQPPQQPSQAQAQAQPAQPQAQQQAAKPPTAAAPTQQARPPAAATTTAPAQSAPARTAAPGGSAATTTTAGATAFTNNKPAKLKVTLIGAPVVGGKPKENPQGQPGLIELEFNAQPGTALPKGLPTGLDSTRVVVWCTGKQYGKVKDTLTPDSRFLIEGELVAAVSADFKPFVRLLALRFTTLDLERAEREQKQQKQQQVTGTVDMAGQV